MFKLVLDKAEEPEIKLPTSNESWKKQESPRKTSISALLTMPKFIWLSTVWITTNCGKFLKRWKYQPTWPGFWETYMQEATVRTGHETTDWFQIGKGVHQVFTLTLWLFHSCRLPRGVLRQQHQYYRGIFQKCDFSDTPDLRMKWETRHRCPKMCVWTGPPSYSDSK